jgi:hypothetical protein
MRCRSPTAALSKNFVATCPKKTLLLLSGRTYLNLLFILCKLPLKTGSYEEVYNLHRYLLFLSMFKCAKPTAEPVAGLKNLRPAKPV